MHLKIESLTKITSPQSPQVIDAYRESINIACLVN